MKWFINAQKQPSFFLMNYFSSKTMIQLRSFHYISNILDFSKKNILINNYTKLINQSNSEKEIEIPYLIIYLHTRFFLVFGTIFFSF